MRLAIDCEYITKVENISKKFGNDWDQIESSSQRENWLFYAFKGLLNSVINNSDTFVWVKRVNKELEHLSVEKYYFNTENNSSFKPVFHFSQGNSTGYSELDNREILEYWINPCFSELDRRTKLLGPKFKGKLNVLNQNLLKLDSLKGYLTSLSSIYTWDQYAAIRQDFGTIIAELEGNEECCTRNREENFRTNIWKNDSVPTFAQIDTKRLIVCYSVNLPIGKFVNFQIGEFREYLYSRHAQCFLRRKGLKEVISQVKSLVAGDLVCVEWCDASIGKSLSNGIAGIDVPVKSWGVFIGVLGKRREHVILAQNTFRYSDGLFDIDYTAVPLPWATSATIIEKSHVSADEAKVLLTSFTINEKAKNEKTTFNRSRCAQRRVRNH